MTETALKQVEQVPASDSATLMQVISKAATDPTYDIDKMERLFKMHESIVVRESEKRFNEAMANVQAKIRRVAPDLHNHQTKSNYASYAALDRVLRPIYTDAGFALSFGTGEPMQDMVMVICHVTNSGHTRLYQIPMPADGKGAKGGDVMSKTHATGSATQYGMRYLLKMIFNIAIGVDIDDDGNGASGEGMNESAFADFEAAIEALVDKPSAEVLWKNIAAACSEAGDMVAYKHLKAKITAKGKIL